MPWPRFWSSVSGGSNDTTLSDKVVEQARKVKAEAQAAASEIESKASEGLDSLQQTPKNEIVSSLTSPSTLVSTAILTTALLTLFTLQRRFLRRFPTASTVPPTYILPNTRRFTRSIFGHVTSIGDADNFRIFHTPLGRLGLWGWLRKVPDEPKALKNNTIHIRLAGIDAPELSHFGRPAQPYSKEAMDWLTSYLRGRRVRCYVHKADQYSRVVATVYIRKWFLRRDVSLQMLRAGLATIYESKSGAEFGGPKLEEAYKQAEETAKRKKKGMWRDAKTLETPREYKNRHREGSPGAES